MKTQIKIAAMMHFAERRPLVLEPRITHSADMLSPSPRALRFDANSKDSAIPEIQHFEAPFFWFATLIVAIPSSLVACVLALLAALCEDFKKSGDYNVHRNRGPTEAAPNGIEQFVFTITGT